MAIALGSNIPSIQAQSRLSRSTEDLRQSFERLSSGLRINRAKDDAAGLAVSESLKGDTRVYTQSIRNFNDGVSLLSVADSAMENLTGIVVRLKELALEASNGTYGTSQRSALDSEAQSLSDEYTRIVQSTGFNGLDLFSATLGTLKLQGGYGSNGAIQSNLGGAVGLGTFTSNATYAAEGVSSNAIAFGDLNGDGIQDLVTAGTTSGGLTTIRLGRADGTFGTATQYTAETTSTTEVSLGDLNGDGVLDLVTAGLSGTTATASVRLGNGDGTFRSATATSLLASSNAPVGLALADFNQDGILDLASTGQDASYPTAIYMLGRGDGTFGAAQSIPGGSGLGRSLSVADSNGDGFLDITAAIDSSVYVARGTGNGSFAGFSVISTGLTAVDEANFGDFNEDGIADFIASGTQIAGKISIRLGTGGGTLGATTTYTMAGASASDLVLGDFNGDGHLDVATAAGTGYGSAIRLGNGDGTFGAIISYSIGGGGTNAIAAADLNGDGVLDIAAVGSNGSGQNAFIRYADVTSGAAPLLPFSLKTRADALQAIGPLDQKLNQITVQRGVIGAFQSRLETGLNTLTIARENFVTATSQITDIDVADEAAKLVRGKILQQAGAAVLAQANSQPKIALDLLKGKVEK